MNLAQAISKTGRFRPEGPSAPIYLPLVKGSIYAKAQGPKQGIYRPLRAWEKRILAFIQANPGCRSPEIVGGCRVKRDAVNTAIHLLRSRELVEGRVTQGSKRYFICQN